MKRINLILLCVTGLLMFSCGSHSANTPVISVENIWSRPVVASEDSSGNASSIGVIYMTIKNRGDVADSLLSVQSSVCKSAEIHESKMIHDRMTMTMLKDGLAIPAKGYIEFKPGSYHVMLIGMKRTLRPGDTFAARLNFEISGTVTVHSHVENP